METVKQINQRIAYLKQNEPGFNEKDISDGDHTFDQLYEFRKIYNAILFNEWAETSKYEVHKSWKYNNGMDCFEGEQFIVIAILPFGQISNHYKAKDWDLFNIPSWEKAKYELDGHTSRYVLNRLKALIDFEQGSQISKEFQENKTIGQRNVQMFTYPTKDKSIENLKHRFASLISDLEALKANGQNARCISIAQTELETSCMYAVKSFFV